MTSSAVAFRIGEPGDMNRLRFALGNNVSTAFAAVNETLVVDVDGNRIQPISNTLAQEAAVFARDTSKPVLLSFVLDMNSKRMHLTFSEPVHGPSLNVSAVSLHPVANSTVAAGIPLTSSTNVTQPIPDGSVVTLVLSKADSNSIKARTDVGNTGGGSG